MPGLELPHLGQGVGEALMAQLDRQTDAVLWLSIRRSLPLPCETDLLRALHAGADPTLGGLRYVFLEEGSLR